MEQLSGQDAVFVYLEAPGRPMHVGSLALYEPSRRFEAHTPYLSVRAVLERRAASVPALRRKLTRIPLALDHPYWVEDAAFDIDRHVRPVRLAPPGDWRRVCEAAAALHAEALDMRRPPWMVHVIEGLDGTDLPPGSFALLARIHHAAADGVTAAALLEALHDEGTDTAARAPPASTLPPNGLVWVARAGRNALRRPLALMRTLGDALPALRRHGGDVLRHAWVTAARAPRTRFDRRVGARRVFDGCVLHGADVARARRVVPGATINDVVLAVCGGALRRYLSDHGELPERSLVAGVPASVRGREAAGNRVVALPLALGTDQADPVARLRQLSAAMYEAKALRRACGERLLAGVGRETPAQLLALGAALLTRTRIGAHLAAPCNCVVTHLPGPTRTLHLGGARLARQYGLGPIMDGVGLFIVALGGRDRLTLGFTSAPEVVPDPEHLAGCMEAACEALCATAIPPGRDTGATRPGTGAPT